MAGLKLTGRFDGDKEAAIPCEKGAHALTGKLPAGSPRMAFGTAVYGLSSRSEKPTLLVYHPKAVSASSTARDPKALTIGEAATLEVVPVTADGKTRFQLLTKGKPVVGAEGSVMLPDGTKEEVKTDKDGYTAAFAQTGRYAVWLRHAETMAGDHAGKKYEEVRHYATLVADVAK